MLSIASAYNLGELGHFCTILAVLLRSFDVGMRDDDNGPQEEEQTCM